MRVVAAVGLVFLLAFASAKVPKTNDEIVAYSFDQYVNDFRKKYQAGTPEYEMRRELFEQKKKTVLAHNTNPVASRLYTKAINQLSDKTPAEFKKRLGGRRREQHKIIEALAQTDLVKVHSPVSGAPLPAQVDWRNRVPSIFTGIKDQGDCGSCWAHASTENLESHWALATGQLWTLSQQMITACTPNPDSCGGTGGCNGATAELAYAYAAKAGIAEEWTYPYTAYNGITGVCMPTKEIQPTGVNITGYTAVKSNDQDAVLDALARVGPLAINVDASTWDDYGTGVYDGCKYNISIDHVVQLVGYGHDDGLKVDYWIVRNSWSPNWGENGFIRLIRHKTPTCGWDVDPSQGTGCNGGPNQLWSCGMCGVLFDTLYPNVNV